MPLIRLPTQTRQEPLDGPAPDTASVLRGVIDALPEIAHIYDRRWRWVHLNPPAAEWLKGLGHDPAALIGKCVWDVFPDLAGTPTHRHSLQAVAEGREVTFRTDALGRHYETRVIPNALGAVSITSDITEHILDRQREAFLAATGGVLTASLDLDTTLSNIARLAVEHIADWCTIDLVDEDGTIRRFEIAHRDPGRKKLAERFRSFTPRPERGGVYDVIRTGRPLLVPRVTEEMIRSRLDDADDLAAVLRARIRSVMSAAMTARGTTLGAITFATADNGRAYDERDLEVAIEIANRAALALDNARLFEAERRAKRNAETASRAKSQFLGIMSHELRTPLNAVIGYADLLLAEVPGPLLPTQRRHVERIRDSARFQTELIEDLLSFARLDAGRENVVLAQADAAAIVADVAALVRPAAERKRIDLVVVRSGHEIPVETDARKLRQIVLNLAGNAVKFTQAGRVEILVSQESDTLCIDVADTGPGIPPDRQEFIFEPFTQLDGANTREAGGTGLGLAIARRLSRLLGGDLTVESSPGNGSRFRLRLPVNAASA